MNVIAEALAWLFDGANWQGPRGLLVGVGVQLGYTFAAVAIACLIAVPLGWLIGHTGRGREIAVALSGAARAVPSFGLLLLLVLLIGVLRLPQAALLTFVLLAIPPILAGAYAGFEAIDRQVIGAARAVGMTPSQVLWRVEVPLGLSLLVAGIRSAVLQVVATVTIAAYVDLGGLGLPIITGLALRDYSRVLGGALLVAILALLLDAVFAALQAAAVPRGIRVGRAPARAGGGRARRVATA
ncbi:ABC transporter permease [uncultured Microbacterium sp.]|uniref:ABC transporter permease n=1 Tax=uncultured Microbacterium sp. TaxID=191216 RepID=UPI0025DFF3DB|nr:ABC transporter permease subunit [uncultured Microbacterium sp.]